MPGARLGPVLVLVGVTLVMLAGCAMVSAMRQDLDRRLGEEPPAPEANGAAGAATRAPAPPETVAPPPAEEPVEEPVDDHEQRPATQLAARTPPAQPPGAAPTPDPDRLLGMSPPEVLASLGAPASRRDEPPAHVWRYTTDSCVLEVSFFLDVASSSRRVLVYDVQTEDGVPEDGLACYREIEQRHAAALEIIDLR